MKPIIALLLLTIPAFTQGTQNVVQKGVVDASQGNWIPPTSTFASPPASPKTGSVYIFTDATAVGTCSGGGSALATCRWSGSAWSAVSGGGSGSGTVTSAFGQTPVADIPVTTTDIATPSNPASGKTTWYTKAGTLCSLSPVGSETCTGGGGGGGVSFSNPYIISGAQSLGPVFELTPPPAGSWTSVNLGTTVIAPTTGNALNIAWETAAGDLTRGYVQAKPGATYTITIHCVQLVGFCGIMLYDSVSTKTSTYYWSNGGSESTARGILRANWTNPNSFVLSSFYYNTTSMPAYTIMQVKDDGVNEVFSFSLDGVTFTPISSVPSGDFLVPTHVGIGSGDIAATSSSHFPIGVYVVSFKLTTP